VTGLEIFLLLVVLLLGSIVGVLAFAFGYASAADTNAWRIIRIEREARDAERQLTQSALEAVRHISDVWRR
jgi:hypothetical protein